MQINIVNTGRMMKYHRFSAIRNNLRSLLLPSIQNRSQLGSCTCCFLSLMPVLDQTSIQSNQATMPFASSSVHLLALKRPRSSKHLNYRAARSRVKLTFTQLKFGGASQASTQTHHCYFHCPRNLENKMDRSIATSDPSVRTSPRPSSHPKYNYFRVYISVSVDQICLWSASDLDRALNRTITDPTCDLAAPRRACRHIS